MTNYTEKTWTELIDNTDDDVRSDNQHILFSWYPAILAASYLVLLVALPGNFLTLVVYIKFDTLKNSTNLLIVNQSISDTLSLFCSQLFFWVNYTKWGLQLASTYKYMCLMTLAILDTSLIRSVLNILLISIERLIAVCYSIHYIRLMTERNTLRMVIGAWTYVLVFASLPLLGWETWKPGTKCMSIVDHPKFYFTFLFLVPIVVILIFVATTNIIIASVAFKKVAKGSPADHFVLETSSQNATYVFKITKMLLTVVGVFFACWTPVIIITLVLIFQPESWTQNGPPEYVLVLHESAKVILMLNSALNPFIYGWKHAQFRSAYLKILKIKEATVHPMAGN